MFLKAFIYHKNLFRLFFNRFHQVLVWLLSYVSLPVPRVLLNSVRKSFPYFDRKEFGFFKAFIYYKNLFRLFFKRFHQVLVWLLRFVSLPVPRVLLNSVRKSFPYLDRQEFCVFKSVYLS